MNIFIYKLLISSNTSYKGIKNKCEIKYMLTNPISELHLISHYQCIKILTKKKYLHTLIQYLVLTYL